MSGRDEFGVGAGETPALCGGVRGFWLNLPHGICRFIPFRVVDSREWDELLL